MTLESSEIKKIIDSYYKHKNKLEELFESLDKSNKLFYKIALRKYNKELDKFKLCLNIILANQEDIYNYITRNNQNSQKAQDFFDEIHKDKKNYDTYSKKTA